MSSNRLLLFYLVTMLYWFSTYTYVPLLSPYVRALGGSLAMAGIVIGSYGFSQMLFRIPLGIWSDRVGRRKPFIFAGIAAATASSLGFALTSSVWGTLVFRSLAGVAAGAWVVFTVLYASYHKHEHAPRAMGIISFYTSIGQMIAATLGGLIAGVYGWHGAFWLAVAGGVAALLLSLGIKENPPVDSASAIRLVDLLRVGKDKIVLGVSTLAVLAQVITFSTMFGFTPQAAVYLGATKADLSWLTLASTLANAIASRLSGGWFASKLGERRVVMLGFGISAVFTAVIPFIHSLPWLYITQAMNGFGQGFCMPVLMGLAIKHIAPNQRATAMGFYQAIYSLGMFGGPAIAGIVGDLFSLEGSFLMVSGVSLAAVFLTVGLAPRSVQRHPFVTSDEEERGL